MVRTPSYCGVALIIHSDAALALTRTLLLSYCHSLSLSLSLALSLALVLALAHTLNLTLTLQGAAPSRPSPPSTPRSLTAMALSSSGGEEGGMPSDFDYVGMTVVELKERLRERGLKVSGKKRYASTTTNATATATTRHTATAAAAATAEIAPTAHHLDHHHPLHSPKSLTPLPPASSSTGSRPPTAVVP